jgi:NADH dehydrogenase FAD-containing subunit
VVSAFPGKKITLVHSRTQLLPRIKGAHDHAYKELVSQGVEVILDDRVVQVRSHKDVTSDGSGR